MKTPNRLFFIAILSFLLVMSGSSFNSRLVSICRAETPSSVVINEVAWMGNAFSSADEWIELYNTTNKDIDLTGWTLQAIDGTPNITLAATTTTKNIPTKIIPAHGFYLLERTDDKTVSDIPADQIYTGALDNDIEVLELRDKNGLVDSTPSPNNSPNGKWVTGKASPDYRTMERYSHNGIGSDAQSWTTNDGMIINGVAADGSTKIKGTPGAQNSSGVTASQTADEQSAGTSEETGSTTPTITSTPTSDSHSPSTDAGPDIIALVDQNISFDATKSSDPDGDSLTYFWNFGDGTTLDKAKPTHSYQHPGTYIVVLEASDGQNVSSDQAKITIYSNSIVISEFMPAPTGKDEENEWIELYNNSDQIADLSGWQVDDIDGGSKPFTIPTNTFLSGHQYLLLSRPTTKISLNNDSDSVRLIYPTGQVAQEIQYIKAKEGQSVSLATAGQYVWSSSPTPGGLNFISADNKTTSNQISAAIIEPKDNTESSQNIIQAQIFPVLSSQAQADSAVSPASASYPAANFASPANTNASNAKNLKQNNQSASLTESIKSSPATTLIVIVIFGSLAGLGLIKIRRRKRLT